MDYLVARNEFGNYCIPMEFSNQSEALKLKEGKVWEGETLRFLREHAGGGDVVHAGTFFGDMLPGLSSACSGVVWAFEPNLISHDAAKLTLQYNRITNVNLHHAALGETHGEVDVLVRNPSGRRLGGRCRIELEKNHPPHLMDRVRLVALDQLIPAERRVILIHLDVEGYEHQVIKGAQSIIRRHRPVIVLETVPPHPWFEGGGIEDLGYRRLKNVDGNAVFACEHPVT